MISWRTKGLLLVALLPLLAGIGVVVWLTVLLPYYDRLVGNVRFISMFSFQFTRWAWIWVITVVAGLISLLYDTGTIRKP